VVGQSRAQKLERRHDLGFPAAVLDHERRRPPAGSVSTEFGARLGGAQAHCILEQFSHAKNCSKVQFPPKLHYKSIFGAEKLTYNATSEEG